MAATAPHFQAPVQRIESVFAGCFARSENTRLVGGASEPLYQPAISADQMHMLCYRDDYFSSALHEISHWCIAGAKRRLQTDFGYWYAPEGRDIDQQQAFETVEYRPQALECFFHAACAYPFKISVDNLDEESGALPDTQGFTQRVLEQCLHWREHGLPDRAQQFFDALVQEFGSGLQVSSVDLQHAEWA